MKTAIRSFRLKLQSYQRDKKIVYQLLDPEENLQEIEKVEHLNYTMNT